MTMPKYQPFMYEGRTVYPVTRPQPYGCEGCIGENSQYLCDKLRYAVAQNHKDSHGCFKIVWTANQAEYVLKRLTS